VTVTKGITVVYEEEDASRRTILVVEDDAGLNRLIRKTLEKEGFLTESAVTGADAVRYAGDPRELIVLLDYLLADMTGTQVIDAWIASNRRFSFVVMTGHGDEKIAVEMMKRGARDYITKSANMIEILPRIIGRICLELDNERQLRAAEEELQIYREHLEELVRARTRELQEANAQLHTEITERKQIEEELRKAKNELELRVRERTAQVREANEELTRSNRDLEQFAYVSSHDLQEPLRMIASHLQLVEKNCKDKLNDQARESLGFAVDGALRMRQLILDLLEYSRVTHRDKSFAPTDCRKIVEQVLANLKLRIEETQARVTCDPLPTIMADQTQMMQVFQNLIGNALKFRNPDQPPCIHIGTEREDTHWRFYVRDNGIGINPEYYEQIFTIFKRLHTRRHYEGNGIGLSIVKRILERHKGLVWVESQPGQGSTFFFTIPFLMEEEMKPE